MDWEAIGAIGDLVGGIGVIVTLAYLAVQVRINSRQVNDATNIAKSQLGSEGWRLSVEGLRALSAGHVGEAWAKAMANSEDLSDLDLAAIHYFLASEWVSSLRQLGVPELGLGPEVDVDTIATKWVNLFLGNDYGLRWWAFMHSRIASGRVELRDAIDRLLSARSLQHREQHAELLKTLRDGALPEALTRKAPHHAAAEHHA